MKTLIESIPNLPDGASFTLGRDIIDTIPDGVSAAAARYLARVTELDVERTNLIIGIVSGGHQTVARALASVRQTQARRDAILAAGSTLPPHARPILHRLLQRVKQHDEVRNRIAHDVWCVSEQLPDCLILLDHEYYVTESAYEHDWHVQWPKPPTVSPEWRPQVAKVLAQDTLTHLCALALETWGLLLSMRAWVGTGAIEGGSEHAELVRGLPDEQLRRTALREQRSRKPRPQSPPEAPPPQP